MGEPIPTAEERVRDLFEYPDGALEDCDRAACAELMVSLMERHASAAVAAVVRHTGRTAKCKVCGFRVGAEHVDENGCPVCSEGQLLARVAELEGILHDAPTIDAVESHVPGWLARVRAALGKEAQT